MKVVSLTESFSILVLTLDLSYIDLVFPDNQINLTV